MNDALADRIGTTRAPRMPPDPMDWIAVCPFCAWRTEEGLVLTSEAADQLLAVHLLSDCPRARVTRLTSEDGSEVGFSTPRATLVALSNEVERLTLEVESLRRERDALRQGRGFAW